MLGKSVPRAMEMLSATVSNQCTRETACRDGRESGQALGATLVRGTLSSRLEFHFPSPIPCVRRCVVVPRASSAVKPKRGRTRQLVALKRVAPYPPVAITSENQAPEAQAY